MINIILLIANFVAALVVFVHGVWAINHMTRHTDHGVRLAWLAITTGAFGVLLSPIYGHTFPAAWEAILNVGIALHVAFERRHHAGRMGFR